MNEYEAARHLLSRDLKAGRINKRQYSQRLRQINKAEGRALYRVAKEAVAKLTDYCERIDREKVRDDLRAKLSESLKRYELAHD